MSYEHRLLFQMISSHLHEYPSCSLQELARKIGVGSRTIETAINAATGRSFRDLRQQMMMLRAKDILISQPASAIKEVSFAMGYKSARSFARAIKRACGISPNQLRARVAGQLTDSFPSSSAIKQPNKSKPVSRLRYSTPG
jgi:transcriptional regulator GlxA family with amidase domain